MNLLIQWMKLFIDVVKNFLGNREAENYKELVEKTVEGYKH